MINRRAFFAASASIGRAQQKPSATASRRPRGRARAGLFAAALLTIFVPRVAAQTPFIQTPGPNLVSPNPAVLAVADVTGDGRPDLISAGGAADKNKMIVVLRNAGNGNFEFSHTNESAPLRPNTLTSLIVGDFTGDGGPDYILGLIDRGPESNVPLYNLRGVVTGSSQFLVAADFNRDGKLDFASAGKSGVSVQLGQGKGSFNESYSTTVAGDHPLVIDVNSDHKPDLAVRMPEGILVLLNDGAGNFEPLLGSPLGARASANGNLTGADFNGDGKPDLAWASTGGLYVLLGDGEGKFTPAPGIPFRTPYYDKLAPTVAADMNLDGIPDIVMGCYAGKYVTLMLNDGAANFSQTVSAPTHQVAKTLAVADFNNDGLPDLAVQNTFWTTADVTGSVSVMLMNSDTGLAARPRSLTFYARAGQASPAAIPVTIESPTSGTAYTVTSSQPWLKPDSNSGVTGSGAGLLLRAEALQAGQAMAAGSYTGRLVVTRSNLFGASVNVTLKVANPSGTLRQASGAEVGESPTSVVQADFNRDGKPDLAVANTTANSVTLLLGDGDGGYAEAATRTVGLHPSSVAAGDFNRDGKTDLAVANTGDNNVTVLLGNGSGDFPASLGPLPAGCGPAALAAADFNKDGALDLAVQDAAPDGFHPPIVLLNDAFGNFKADSPTACTQSGQAGRASLVVADFDGNGNPDLAAVSSIVEGVYIWLGDGAGGFVATGLPNLAVVDGALAAEDFDGDGKQDVAVAGAGGGVMIVRGRGNGWLQSSPSGTYLPYATAVQSLTLGDFDGDGRPDLAVHDAGRGITVLLGDGNGGFTETSGRRWVMDGVCPNLSGSVTAGDWNGDGRTDLAVPVSCGQEVKVLLGNPALTTSVLSTTAGAIVAYGSDVPLSLTVSSPEMTLDGVFDSVTFYDGDKVLGTMTGTNNEYTFHPVNLAPGIHHLSARYGGNDRNVGSISNTITVEVTLGASVGASVSSGTGAASPFQSPGLEQNQLLLSPNAKYAAAMQSDGNFVIYAEGSAIWSTQTQNSRRAPYRLAVQPDGNLVIYGSSDQDVSLGAFGVCPAGSACIPAWSTGPRGGTAPYTLTMQDDGNLVMYDSTSRAVWFTGTQR